MIDAEFRDLLLFGAFKAAALWAIKHLHDASRWRIPEKWESAGRVSRLVYFPVKSCGAVSAQRLVASELGFHPPDNDAVLDRHWMVVSPGGTFITQRQESSLSLIRVRYTSEHLVLAAPNMEDLLIPLKSDARNGIVHTKVWDMAVDGIDCGQDATEWISKYLDKPGFHIVHLGSLPPRDLNSFPLLRRITRETDRSAYNDLSPYMLTVQESLDDLNTRLKHPVPMERFRGNIVMSGAKAPFDEDNWAFVKIGDTVFHRIKPCTRCIMTTIDQETGVRDAGSEPLNTLKSYRCREPWGKSPIFGTLLGIDSCGSIQVGDQVFVSR